jgi:hypothetical protein
MMNTPSCKSAKAMVPAVDRISGLPDELLHHVMSLPAEDVVCTCVCCHLGGATSGLP